MDLLPAPRPLGTRRAAGAATRRAERSAAPPIVRLAVRPDAHVGDTGFASIDVQYSVAPGCRDQAVMVATSVTEHLDPSVAVHGNPLAPRCGSFTVVGVRTRVTYKVSVSVYDEATGALLGSQTTFTAAIPRGV